MINISDITAYYIGVAFTDPQKVLILEGFSLLEDYGIEYYEDRYVNLITDNSVDPDSRALMFMTFMSEDITNIILQHGITLSKENEPSLGDLVELCHLLLLLPNLEDYSDVAYKVHGNKTPRNTLIDLVERYSTLPFIRGMEIIEDVSEKLIESLRSISVGAFDVPEETVDNNHMNYISTFKKFTNNTPCMGFSLLDKGFPTSMTINELVNVVEFNVQQQLETLSVTNTAQVGLDVLSMLIVSRDDYTMPVFKFKKNSHLFTDKPELMSRMIGLITKIMNDFTLFLDATREQEKLNDN